MVGLVGKVGIKLHPPKDSPILRYEKKTTKIFKYVRQRLVENSLISLLLLILSVTLL